MSQPDLRLVTANDAPFKPALRVQTFTIVETDNCTVFYRDGKLIDVVTVAGLLVEIMEEGAAKARRAELAMPPVNGPGAA